MRTYIAVLLFLGLALALIDDASARRRWWHRRRYDDSRNEDCERSRPPFQEDGYNLLCRYRCVGRLFRYGREEDGTPCVYRLRRSGLCYRGRCVSERRYERVGGPERYPDDDVTDRPGWDHDVTDRPGSDHDVTDRPGPDHDVTDRPGPDHDVTDRPGPDHDVTDRPNGTQDPGYDYTDNDKATSGQPTPTPEVPTARSPTV